MFFNIEAIKVPEIYFLFHQIAMVRRKPINNEKIGIMTRPKIMLLLLGI